MSHSEPRPGDTVSLAEKAAATSGASAWRTTEVAGVLASLALNDGPHGLRVPVGTDGIGLDGSLPATCFPPAVALGSTWDPALAGRMGQALGLEAGALGVDVLLGPGMNIKRSPLCGRNFEYLSEDPLLTGRIAAALVIGIQQCGVGACVKHFAVNNQETDRMRVSAEIDERTLREIYLRAFEHVIITAAPAAVMGAYNKINGTYASQHPWLLTQVLREEWGFEGIVMSDWGAIRDRVTALAAGCDLEMPPTHTDNEIVEAIEAGRLEEKVLDVALDRLVALDRRLDRGVRPAREDLAAIQETNARLAHEIALSAPVLLANDGLLPVSPGAGSVAIIGELARTPRIQGGGSSRVTPTVTRTPLEALTERLGDRARFRAGYALDGNGEELAAEAVAAARDADVVLLFLGLPEHAELEGVDRDTFALPEDQLSLLSAVHEVNDRVAVVLSNGSVVSVAEWREQAAAILECWLLGQAGGDAIADLLVGAASPSGRLTESIPLRIEDHPSYPTFPGADGISLYGEGVFVGYRGLDARGTEVAYPFGHGLTYSSFDYADAVAIATPEEITVTFTLTNTGTALATETVQLYVGPAGALPAPRRAPAELRDFARVELEPGASQQVALGLAVSDLRVWDTRAGAWRVDPGDYVVRVGASSRDIRLEEQVHVEIDRVGPELTAMSTVAEWLQDPGGQAILMRLVQQSAIGTAAGGLGGLSAEVMAILAGLPMDALRSFGMGLDHDAIAGLVAEAAASRGAAADIVGVA